MGKCLVCQKELGKEEVKCSECGFGTRIPMFFAESQYVEWNRKVVIPYMLEFKKKQQEDEKKKAEEEKKLLTLVEEAAKEIARRISEERGETLSSEVVEKVFSKVISLQKKKGKQNLDLHVEEILSKQDLSKPQTEDVDKFYVIFLQDGGRMETLPNTQQNQDFSEEWSAMRESLKKQFEEKEFLKDENALAKVRKSIQAELQTEIAGALLNSKQPEVLKFAGECFKINKNMDACRQEIEKKSLEIFGEIDEDKKAEFVKKAEKLSDTELNKCLAAELQKMKDELQSAIAEKTSFLKPKSLDSAGKSMCAFGFDFHLWFQENADSQIEILGDIPLFFRQLRTWKNVASIAAGNGHALGLEKTGTVLAAGDNQLDQCDVKRWKDIVQIAACGANSAALDRAGSVYTCGADEELRESGQWTGIRKIALGEHHILGLKADGTVVAAGYTDDGQCDVSNWKNITDIAAGEYHSLGITADGTVVAAGSNLDGECNVEEWRNVISVKAGNGISVGLQKDGKLLLAGEEVVKPQISGYIKDIGLSQSGEVRCLWKVCDHQ